MSNSRMLLAVAAVVAVGLAVMLWLWSVNRAGDLTPVTERATIQLFFPAEEGWIGEEAREVEDLPQEDSSRARRVVAELLAGPSIETHYPLLPAGTEVDGAFVDEDGTCLIELTSEAYAQPPQMGSRQEAELYASLLSSLSANVSPVRRVVLLWNGRQPESFGGHFDTTQPVRLEAAAAVASAAATAQ